MEYRTEGDRKAKRAARTTVKSGNGTRAPDGRSCQAAKQPARTAWRSQKTVSGCILADGGASLSFACRAGKRRSRKTAFRLAFALTISDGPRTARCLLPAREGPRLRRHRT